MVDWYGAVKGSNRDWEPVQKCLRQVLGYVCTRRRDNKREEEKSKTMSETKRRKLRMGRDG